MSAKDTITNQSSAAFSDDKHPPLHNQTKQYHRNQKKVEYRQCESYPQLLYAKDKKAKGSGSFMFIASAFDQESVTDNSFKDKSEMYRM